MKKACSLFLSVTLVLIVCLTGCGSGNSSQPPAAASSTAVSVSSDASAEAAAGSLGIPVPKTPYMIQFAGATSGGSYFLICNAIAEMLNSEYSEYFNASVQSTAGSAAILRALQDGEVEFGIAQAGLALDAQLGQNSFEEKWQNFSSVCYTFPTVMHLVTNDDTVKSFADFKGKRIAVGAAGSATEINSRVLCDVYGLTYDDFRSVEYTSESQTVELLKNKQIDGANLIAAQGSASPTDLMSSSGFEIISFTDEDISKILEQAGSFYKYKIPANTYMNQDYDVNTYAVANFLYANNSVEEDVVYAVTKAIMDNHDYLAEVYSLISGMSPETATDGLTVELHSGAEKYFKEINVK